MGVLPMKRKIPIETCISDHGELGPFTVLGFVHHHQDVRRRKRRPKLPIDSYLVSREAYLEKRRRVGLAPPFQGCHLLWSVG